MEHDERNKTPGKAGSDGKAGHGYRNEVSWDGGRGRGRQPYTNQEKELRPAAAREFEGGDAGEVAGRNLEQMEEVAGTPDRSGREEDPRQT